MDLTINNVGKAEIVNNLEKVVEITLTDIEEINLTSGGSKNFVEFAGK